MLIVQSISVVCLFLWGSLATLPIIWCVNKIMPVRLDAEDELKGCDICEHYMGDEDEKLPLNTMQISNVRFGSPQVNYALPANSYPLNATYKEFDTVVQRKPFHTNLSFEGEENVARIQTTERL